MHDHQDGSECPGEDCALQPGPAEDASPVIQALCRAARLYHQLAWQLLRTAGLHPGQEVIMMRLWADGPQQPAALIRLLGSDAATITRSVQRLERAGFVRRKPSRPTAARSSSSRPRRARHCAPRSRRSGRVSRSSARRASPTTSERKRLSFSQ